MQKLLKASSLTLFCSATLVALSLTVAAITIFKDKPLYQKLQTEGITVTATVARKYKKSAPSCTQTNCVRSILYLTYFSNNTSESRSSELTVSTNFYDNTPSGSAIDITYLANSPEEVWRAERVKAWSLWSSGLTGSLIILSLAGLLLIPYALYKRKEQKLWEALEL